MQAACSPKRPRLVAAGFGAAIAGLAISSCASAETYNPARLDQAHLGEVVGICQSVMGLQADEPPLLGNDNPRLTPLENHYQGCIASLSGSLRGVADRAAVLTADQTCRTGGAAPGSPQLAQCVLKSVRANRGAAGAGAEALTATPVAGVQIATPARSFYGIGNHEKARRIGEACAQLGLNPAYGAFDACVKDMKDTFYAIDNPWR